MTSKQRQITGEGTGSSKDAAHARRVRFAREYLIDLNATQAAIRAGYATKSASMRATVLLRDPVVIAELQRARAEVSERLDCSLHEVVRDAWLVLTADVRELVDVRIGCCRYCYGSGHKRQRTVAEFNADFERWSNRRGKPVDAEFDEEGGIGFDPRRQPAAECPACFGDGAPRVVMHDTRNLSPAAAKLYLGAKRTATGETQMLVRDKDAARETLMRHLGGYAVDNEQKRTPLAEALGGFLAQLHDDEAGAIRHAPAPLRAIDAKKSAA